MKRRASLLLCALLLLLLDSRADAACTRVVNDDLIEYSCERGSVEDLQIVPNNVEKIRISYMPVRRITEPMFSRFGSTLVVLTCSYCEISEVDDNAFRQLRNLQQLSLDNNYLTEVKGTWFEGLRDLSYLDLNYNQITRIDGDVFRNAPDVVDLRVSGNRLQCLDLKSMAQLKELKRIFINENANFGCPHALKRFLIERNVDFEADPQWSLIGQDVVAVDEPLPPLPPTPPIEPPRWTERPTAPPPPPPTQPPRRTWTEEPPRRPWTEEPPRRTWTEEPPRRTWTEVPLTLPTMESVTNPPRPTVRPYVPEMIQPSVPASDFAYQPPYYDPKVTQNQLDSYRNTATQQLQNASEIAKQKANEAAAKASTAPTVLVAGFNTQQPTTTECPNSADLFRHSPLLIPMMLATLAAMRRW